jgi:hypothetical protein
MRETGHRDKDGNWVPETPQAKIRNRLTPFWTLTSILSENEWKDNPEIMEMVTGLAKQCEELKPIILDLLIQTEK